MIRRFAFRTVSQLALNYRRSALNSGTAGNVSGGDRLPWIQIGFHGPNKDNHVPLGSLTWQLHVYGVATEAATAVARSHEIALQVFAWT